MDLWIVWEVFVREELLGSGGLAPQGDVDLRHGRHARQGEGRALRGAEELERGELEQVEAVVDEEVNVAGVVDRREVHGAIVRADEGAGVRVHCFKILNS